LEVVECSSAEAAELVVATSGSELKALVTDVSLKWSACVEGMIIVSGNEQTRAAAVTAAEKAIDRALVGRSGPPLQPD
jgi:hypothetical protein